MMKIDIKDLLGKSLMIATPRYGGVSIGRHTDAFDDVRIVFNQWGLPLMRASVDNDSCIARARNTLADTFMRSPCTHLLFWDGDVIATPDDVVGLLAQDKDVVCGLYPKKHIHWGKVQAAVRQGIAKDDLSQFVGDMVFNPIGLKGEYGLYEPLEVAECGTGFMMIQRRVFESFIEHYPLRRYRIDHRGADEWSRAYFIDEVDPMSRRFLTEDYNFCRLLRAIGLKIWVCPWMNLSHIGSFCYEGNPAAVSSLQPVKEQLYG